MTEAAGIHDEATLQRWLEGRPVDDARLIALRIACRLMPMYVQSRVVGPNFTAMEVCRLLLTLRGVTRVRTSEGIAAASAAYGVYGGADTTFAAYAAVAANEVAAAAYYAASAAVEAADYVVDVGRPNFFWVDIRGEAEFLEVGADLLVRPLWPSEVPEWFTKANAEMRAIWAKEPDVWAFWLRWWDGVISGRQLDWALQEKVALIEDPVWERGPAAVAAEIARISNDLAIAATDNGERIEINPATGKLVLVAESALPDDIAGSARRKMLAAAGIFGPEPANQYTGLQRVLDRLREAVAGTAELPVELYDACASASRLTRGFGRAGNCPTDKEDPLVAEFLTQLREVASDILANDPSTQEVLARRAAIDDNAALIEARDLVIEATATVIPITEGRLATALPEDAEVATDPQADKEERVAASFRWAGRMLRISSLVADGGAGAVIKTAGVLVALPVIAASPITQEILKWIAQLLDPIMRWLSFM